MTVGIVGLGFRCLPGRMCIPMPCTSLSPWRPRSSLGHKRHLQPISCHTFDAQRERVETGDVSWLWLGLGVVTQTELEEETPSFQSVFYSCPVFVAEGWITDLAMHWCRTGLEPFLYDNEGSAWWGGKGNLVNINFLKLKHTHTQSALGEEKERELSQVSWYSCLHDCFSACEWVNSV